MRANLMDEAGDIILEDLEGLLREINDFTSSNPNKPEEIPQTLEGYLSYVAKTGNTVFPWQHVRPLFRNKILQAMDQFPGESCPVSESFVMERFDLFRSAPFTIQRLAELITQPTRHYKKKGKFLNGLEKTVLVVSTIEPWSIDNDFRNGNDDGTGSDGEMDQTYSESDEGGNRSFDSDQQEVVMTDGQGEGTYLRASTGTSISLDNVTTTMVNITSNSNGSQSTAAIMTSATAVQIEEMATSELGLSAVVTNEDGATASSSSSGEQRVNQASENFMQMEESRLSDIVVTTGVSGEAFVSEGEGSGVVLQGLELTSVEVSTGLENATEEESSTPERTSANLEGSTLQVEHVEVLNLPSCQLITDSAESLKNSSENSNVGAMDVDASSSVTTENSNQSDTSGNDAESLISTVATAPQIQSTSVVDSTEAISTSGTGIIETTSTVKMQSFASENTCDTEPPIASEDQISDVPVVPDLKDATDDSSDKAQTSVSNISSPPTLTNPVPEVLTTTTDPELPSSE